MTIIKRDPLTRGGNRTTIFVQGTEIELIHTCFEVGIPAWNKLSEMMMEKYGTSYRKSYVMRILVNALVYGIIDIDDLEAKLIKYADKTDDVIYI